MRTLEKRREEMQEGKKQFTNLHVATHKLVHDSIFN
jgi:hypothetical protein